MGKGGVPDGWKYYTNMGRQISGTRFLAFKTPLRMASCDSLDSCQLFTTRDLIDSCSSLGLVINLTFKTKYGYYDFKDVKSAGIDYSAVPIPGHVIPEQTFVFKFFQVVEKFLKENESNEKLIGVHCTHGLNRTGYLICRYMIDRLNVPPDQAIIEFNSARGHEQNRENYLEDLRTKQLSEEYKNWVKEQAKINPTDVIPLTPEVTKRGWHLDKPNDFQQMSRKRKSTEIVDEEERNHKRVKYSSEVNLRNLEEDHYTSGSSSHTSPSIGKTYYQNYYRGEVQHQYRMDYYHPRGDEFFPGPSGVAGHYYNYDSCRSKSMPPRCSFEQQFEGGLPAMMTRQPTKLSPSLNKNPANDLGNSNSQPPSNDNVEHKSKYNTALYKVVNSKSRQSTANDKGKKSTIAQKFFNKLKFKKDASKKKPNNDN